MTAIGIFALTALCEIAGCFAFWAWARQGASALWLVPGVAALIAFAWLLTRVDSDFAGRAYAAYGGIYIVASLAWLWGYEGMRPDRWDLIGGAICLAGTVLILYGPRSV
ncbi:YnfA family protein [Hyphomicrobium sp. LHD-15]|uniref:YnfA family protein n=1 Tax=Hyphomicrobium sp. LHD-15 TaxID=3072142 RepID=UPI00280FB25F|nr:YnfA family protein [Hyphomicrobium sp. LHD-15]MDQ8700773.1 YnfA family protein [Hyphomicrobium sp. LHD-15]